MAYVANPNYGTLPGAPMRVNWWTPAASPWQLSRFNISDLLATLPPVQSPLTPTVTPQDDAAQAGAVELRTDTGGAQGGGGSGPGTGPGGLGRDPTAQERNPGTGFAIDRSGLLGMTATPGSPDYIGTYGEKAGPWGTVGAPPGSPAAFNSNYGLYGGALGFGLGTALGVPGIGMALGTIGENVDLARYVDNLRASGVPIDPSYVQATIAGLSSLPFGLGNIFGTSARQQQENARREALAMGNMNVTSRGPTAIDDVEKTILENPEIFGLQNAGYIGPGTPPAFDPASLGREAGYGGTAGVMGAPQGGTGYQSGTYVSGIEGGSPDSAAGYGGAPTTSGGGSVSGIGNSGVDFGGGDRFGFYKGGLIGAPPGRYAAGGQVLQPGDNISPAAFGMLRAINPPGPDDQIGALQSGEGVLTRAAIARYPGLLAAANAGTLDPGRVKGLLTPAGTGRKPRLIR
jgi:hypothetical protein